MNDVLSLADSESLSDLTVFISRAKRVDDQAVRVAVNGGVLVVTTAVLAPRGLLDTGPTILALRTLRVTGDAAFDRVVRPESMLERLVRAERDGTSGSIPMPPTEARASWSGVAPPKGGWMRVDALESTLLARVAREGAAEIAGALPENAGDHIVQRVRSQVWSRPIDEAPGVSAGAAFAAEAMGFLVGPETVGVFASGQWLRLSLLRGHVLVHRRATEVSGA